MFNWINKGDKPAYLKYKRGHIIEKERTEREHLLLEDLPDSASPVEEEEDFVTAPPKKRLTMILGVISLVVFAFVFYRVVGMYTTNIYGEKTDSSGISLDWPTIPSSEKAEPVVDLPLPTSPEADGEGNVGLEKPVSIDPPVIKPSFVDRVKETETYQEITAVYPFTASIHEELIQSVEQIKGTVVRYTNNQANKMTVNSRIDKELLTYSYLQKLVETRLDNIQEKDNNQREVLLLLQSQLAGLSGEVEALKEVSRIDLVDQTNQLIERENTNREAFLVTLKEALAGDGIPFTEVDGQLVF